MSGTQISAGQKSRTPFSFNFLQGARQLLDEDRADAIKGRLLPPGSANYYKEAWDKSNGEDFSRNATRRGVVSADLAMEAYWKKVPNMPHLREGTEGAVGAHDPNDDFIEETKGSIAKKMRGKKDVPKPLEDGYDGAIVNENSVVAVAPVADGAEPPVAHREPGRSRGGSDAGEAKEASGRESESEGEGERPAPAPASVGGGAGSARAKSALAKGLPTATTGTSDPKPRVSMASASVASSILAGGGGGGGAGLEPYSDAQLEGIVRKAERMAGGRAGRA
jgi:hypothetical protein